MKAFNKIMSTFSKVVDKLDKLEDSNINEKIAIDEEMNRLKQNSYLLGTEAEIASSTAAKIREFYKVD